MATAGKITEKIGQYITDNSVYKKNRQIARDVGTVFGVSLSHTAVANFLKQNRQERAEITKEVVRDHIRTTLPTDLETLEQIRNQLNNWRLGIDEDGNPLPPIKITEKLMVIDRLHKVIDLRLKYSGAGEADKPEFADLSDEELELMLNE